MTTPRLLIILLAIVLSGCHAPYQVLLPNGHYAWAVECNDVAARCFEKISYVCDGGYTIINREFAEVEGSGLVATKDFMVAKSRRGHLLSITFICK